MNKLNRLRETYKKKLIGYKKQQDVYNNMMQQDSLSNEEKIMVAEYIKVLNNKISELEENIIELDVELFG